MPEKGTYKISRKCVDCGHEDEIGVTRSEAAFILVDIDERLGATCKICSSTLFSRSYETPTPDLALLKEWAEDEELHFSAYDDDLVLAEAENLNIILEVLDTMPLSDYKTAALMSALCILVYDNSSTNDAAAGQLRLRVIGELNKRLDKLKLADGLSREFIKEKVYPLLDVEV
ncbi:hypothetical protein [Chitinophaga alhagiae]|uniref:hypothetical protein n=1 Tax=Chitinophaga alhagiae TaxID=2203219 RepID=UPI000E5BB4F7|nr:hypothetical protein [Chitinophaga alhagiae]